MSNEFASIEAFVSCVIFLVLVFGFFHLGFYSILSVYIVGFYLFLGAFKFLGVN